MKRFNITVNGTSYDVQVEELAAGAPVPAAVQAPAAVPAPPPAAAVQAAPQQEVVTAAAPASAAGAITVEAPMPGGIIDIKVSAGQYVEANQPLLILEAMKMENEIVAPVAGTVAGIHVNKGDSVDTGTLLVSLS